ncbi:class II aldolase [bacterium]|nr:MAG: class II aldolase [bacterium]
MSSTPMSVPCVAPAAPEGKAAAAIPSTAERTRSLRESTPPFTRRDAGGYTLGVINAVPILATQQMPPDTTKVQRDVAEMGAALGETSERLAMLAEGNGSGREDDGTFWIKASGKSMATGNPADLVQVRFEPILAALEEDLDDTAVRERLDASRVDPTAPRPSVETFMHAVLLALPGIRYVAHTHPEALLALLCTDRAREEAGRRYFPDEVVLCGPESPYVPYVDPGLTLARTIRDTLAGREMPRTIWLENHGLIAIGETTGQCIGATRMAEKAARIRAMGATRPLSEADVARIGGRPDEHHRQRQLWK